MSGDKRTGHGVGPVAAHQHLHEILILVAEYTRFLAALARTSLRHGRIPAIFNGRVCCRGNDVPVLDANHSVHFPFLDCLQHG